MKKQVRIVKTTETIGNETTTVFHVERKILWFWVAYYDDNHYNDGYMTWNNFKEAKEWAVYQQRKTFITKIIYVL